MAVYERGYRAYEGGFRAAPPAWTLFREAAGMAWRRKGYRRLLYTTGMIVLATAGMLYFEIIVEQEMRKQSAGMMRMQLIELTDIFHGVHVLTTLLVSLVAVLIGAGLVSDDLRSRGLALYLVRPIRPVDYMLGKALVLPVMLVPIALLPGLLLWLLVALWQPPGETWAFMQEHADIAWRVGGFYLIAASSLTGLMLLLSSRTPRRGAVIGLAAAVLFGGPFVRAIGRALDGGLGTVMKSFDLMNNMVWRFTMARREIRGRGERWRAWQPDPDMIVVVCLVLLAAGLYFVWRRARSVEVSS